MADEKLNKSPREDYSEDRILSSDCVRWRMKFFGDLNIQMRSSSCPWQAMTLSHINGKYIENIWNVNLKFKEYIECKCFKYIKNTFEYM